MREPIPVTVLTGFLGAGKTTLLKHILQAEHGLKIAVIENEFSALDVDGELLEDAGAVQLMKVANGCVCCTGSKDLAYALTVLLERLDSGELAGVGTNGIVVTEGPTTKADVLIDFTSPAALPMTTWSGRTTWPPSNSS